MGRLLFLLLIIAAVVLLWVAFGPGARKRNATQQAPVKEIKGPDDDEEFLWNLEKEAFKQRRERERQEEERRRREEKDKD